MKQITRDEYYERILNVINHIHKNLDRQLPLEELAGVANFSRYHFHRIFKGIVGENLAEYVRRVKLQRAAQKLILTEKKVTEIAFEAGYDSLESFIRAFQSKFFVTPNNYRKSYRNSKDQISQINDYNLRTGGVAAMEVQIVKMPAIKVAYSRHRGPYEMCGPAWDRLCCWAVENKQMNYDTRYFGLCYDDPDVTQPDDIRYDACISVSDGVEASDEIKIGEIGGGDYAVVLHKGPLNDLYFTYSQVYGKWLPDSGREIKDLPGIDEYLNNPDDTPPNEIKVMIHIPLL